jgi:hypothetical protein
MVMATKRKRTPARKKKAISKKQPARRKVTQAKVSNGADDDAMSAEQYRDALGELGLTVAGKATAEALGLGMRQIMRLANGDAPVPGPVERLLGMYLKHGLPP